jgi:alkylated DNA repair dioxygenase AlkB
LYRNGQDSNGWHADDEKELGEFPKIASVSFGASRKFKMRRKDNHKEKFEIVLNHGSLLLMLGKTQAYWQHQIPKTRKIISERINLTFRIIE